MKNKYLISFFLLIVTFSSSCKKEDSGDGTVPEIILLGTNPLYWALDLPYVDAGAIAYDITPSGDTVDLTNSIVTTNNIDISTLGDYDVKYNVVDDVDIILNYSNGIKGSMWLSKTAIGYRNGLQIEVYGSKASALWHQENPEKLEFSYNTGQKIIIDRGSDIEMLPNKLYNRMTAGHPSGYIESFANLYNDIANSLDNFFNNQPYTTNYIYDLKHASNGINLFHNASLSNIKKIWI